MEKILTRILKKILKVLAVMAILMVLTIFIIFKIEARDLSYLEISDERFNTNSYLIQNVNLIPMTRDTILPQRSVLVQNGVITRIDSLISSNGIPVIDGTNKYLTPGLIDMHVHVWDRHELGLYLANGVTAVRNMWGIPAHLRIKEQLNNNELLGPVFYTATPKLTGPEDLGPDKKQIKDPEEARALIKHYKTEGYDLIKTYSGLPKNIYDAIIEQAEIEGLTIAAHPSYKIDYSDHFKPVFETIEHTEEIVQTALKFDIDSTKLQAVVDLYKSHGNTHTPTLTIFQNIIDILEQEHSILESEASSYVNPGFIQIGSMDDLNRWTSTKAQDASIVDRIKQQHQQHLKIVKQMHDQGINIVCGTDAGIMFAAPGFSTHEELGYFVEAGLSNYEAMATATVNVSKTATLYKDLGTIAEGKTANLLLLNSNPLENIEALKTPETVWVRGRMINRDAITLFKDKAKHRTTGAASILRLLESFIR